MPARESRTPDAIPYFVTPPKSGLILFGKDLFRFVSYGEYGELGNH
jgi:hypothetical protein